MAEIRKEKCHGKGHEVGIERLKPTDVMGDKAHGNVDDRDGAASQYKCGDASYRHC